MRRIEVYTAAGGRRDAAAVRNRASTCDSNDDSPARVAQLILS